MEELKLVQGIVLKHYPVGEYDYAVTIFTATDGKISAFARSARKPGGRLSGCVEPFCFGTFKLFVGKSSYTITEADISNYFEGFRKDFDSSLYGTLLLEIADYYTRENAEDKELLNLLYLSLKALLNQNLPNKLVKCVFFLRALLIEGEYPGAPTDMAVSADCARALDYIENSSLEKLYTFTVSQEVLLELERITTAYIGRYIDRPLKAMDMLESFDI